MEKDDNETSNIEKLKSTIEPLLTSDCFLFGRPSFHLIVDHPVTFRLLWSMELGVRASRVARVEPSLECPFVARELAKDRVRSRGSFWSNLTTSALSLHHDHDVVEQLALARVVFKSLPTHPELCAAGLWILGSELGRSSSFFFRTRGAAGSEPPTT